MANQSITAPQGFEVAGVSCGIKQSGNLDLGVIYCATGAKAAAVFTTNQVVSAAVTVCREHAKSAKVYAVVANSGNANACTGKQGFKHSRTVVTKPGNPIAFAYAQLLLQNSCEPGNAVFKFSVTDLPAIKDNRSFTRGSLCPMFNPARERDQKHNRPLRGEKDKRPVLPLDYKIN